MASTGDAQAQAAATSKDALMSAVATYLKKKGYNKSLEAFGSESGFSVDRMATSQDLLADASLLQAVVNYNPAEKLPGSFEASFQALNDWIDRSLDQCKVRKTPKSTIKAKFA